MSQQIPDELIVGILPWLPVKSLLRFRSVSKDIGALIESTDFINSHNLCKSSDQNFNLLKLISSDRLGKFFHVCDANLDMEKKILQLEKSYSSQQQFKVCGYCKGLILLNRGLDELFGLTLWNPSTNKYKDLPHCPFGDDYKAFIIFRMRYCDVQVWVYELKSNIWRRIHYNIPPSFSRVGCFTDGSLHWLCEQIVSFDIRKETFCLAPRPVCSINTTYGVSTVLHDLEGCLCISDFYYFGHFQADLYMRKKDGVVDDDQFTWIQLYSLRQPVLPVYFIKMFFSGTIQVWEYPKRGDDKAKILFHLSDKDYMVSYDFEKKTFGKVKIVNKDPTWVAQFFCIESLVQIASESGASSSEQFDID